MAIQSRDAKEPLAPAHYTDAGDLPLFFWLTITRGKPIRQEELQEFILRTDSDAFWTLRDVVFRTGLQLCNKPRVCFGTELTLNRPAVIRDTSA